MALDPTHPQPDETDIKLSAGIFIKQMRCSKAGTLIPQHAHEFDHVSVVARGAVRVMRENVGTVAEFMAPNSILIPAGEKHLFLTLLDDTVILCVHDADSLEDVGIVARNDLFVKEV